MSSVRITGTGHASMRIDTPAGSILCDPWVNPAYFASWFPFPDNSQLDWETLGDCDYLYVSFHASYVAGSVSLFSKMSRKSMIFISFSPPLPFQNCGLESSLACFSYLRHETGKVNCPGGDQRTCGSALVRGSRLALDKRKPGCPDWVAYGGCKLERRLCRPLKRQLSMSALATEGRQGRATEKP